jgi:hypothetical protein
LANKQYLGVQRRSMLSLINRWEAKSCRFWFVEEGWDDFVRWPHTKNGVYLVRSAYKLARSSKFFVSPST